MSMKRLDGKIELEKSMEQWQKISEDNYHLGNMYPLKDDGVSEGSQLTITSSSNNGVSMLQDSVISIEFKNRDALLEALCIKTLGAKPIYTMTPNIDIIKDFSAVQASNSDLSKTNVKFVNRILELENKINDALQTTVYVSTIGDGVPLREALDILDEDHIDSGQLCDATVFDLLAALKKLL
jgi:hypothetical protein